MYLAKLLGGGGKEKKTKKKKKKKDDKDKQSKKRSRLAVLYGDESSSGHKRSRVEAVSTSAPQESVRPTPAAVARLDSDSDSDADPPRPQVVTKTTSARLNSDSDSDANPTRRPPAVTIDSGTATVRRDSDESSSDSDANPPRRPQETTEAVPLTMRDGAKAGLLEYSDFQLDQQRLRKEKAEAALSADSGALAANPASTVYRDKTGRRMTASEALEKEGVLEARKEAQRLEQTRGQVQKDEIARKVKLAQEIANAPFSRYRDDKTLEKHLKTRTRAEDPMAQYLGLSIDEPTTDGGATVEGSSTPRTSFPAYKGMRPPNRYNIVPGHRWDGIERGNGFESKVMASLLKKKHDRQHDFASRSRNM